MNIVIDTSVIIAAIANQTHKEKLIELTVGADLIAPSSVHWEIGNAFSVMLKRGRLTLPQILKAVEIYHQIPIRFAEVELADTLRIAAEYNVYTYDAYLLRCASKYSAPLISLDRNLIRVAREMNVGVVEVMEE